MAQVTASAMHDARDAEDIRLLAAGEHGALVESYFETIIQRCRVRCRTEDDALDCAQAVFVRLLAELRRGRRYSVPYRVVVHKVIEWTTKGFYERGRAVIVEFDDDLPEEVFRPADPSADVETRYDLERALAGLPQGDREIARLCYLDGVEIERVAEPTGKKRNAVDQGRCRWSSCSRRGSSMPTARRSARCGWRTLSAALSSSRRTDTKLGHTVGGLALVCVYDRV